MTKRSLPTPEELRQLLRYEPDTGKLYWKPRPAEMFDGGGYPPERLAKTWNTKFSGAEAGSPNGTGHLRMAVYGRRVVAHWIAWCLHYGEWPPSGFEVDHINMDGTDNRISNLRLATRSQNAHNRNPPSSNISGVKGVSWHKQGKKWQVKFGLHGKQHYLGLFTEFDEAVRVRSEAVRRLVGEFSRETV